MKFKDIYTHLSQTINLQKFHPKIEINVDDFLTSQKEIDISESLEQTIDASGNKNFVIKPLCATQKPFDSVFKEKKNLVYYTKKTKKRFKLGYIKSKLINFGDYLSSLSHRSKLFKYLSIIICIFILVFFNKFLVKYNTDSGYKKILSIAQNKNSNSISKTIHSAYSNFVIAQVLFTPFRIIPNKQVNNTYKLISGGKKITSVIKKNLKIGEEITQFINEKGGNNIMFSQLLLNNKEVFQDLETDIAAIEKIYNSIDFNESQNEYTKKLNIFKEKLKQAKFYIYTFNNNFDNFLEIFGHSKRKKYLIAFQNNDEIRALGGFMGSVGIVEIFRGQVKKFDKNDIYFYEFKIKKEQFNKEISPEGINKMTPYLGLRDSNYYINHKDSSNKIRYFMKKAGYEIDGIIYLNMNTLSQILDLVGEFESKVLNQKVNSHNFSTIMSILVESKISKKGTTGTPKQVLFDFMKEFNEVLDKKHISKISIIKILAQNISSRDIILYNFKKQERVLMQSISLYNPINYSSSLDFSYPVFTSISGNKSDRYIKHSYKKTVTKGSKCSFYTTLTLQNQHSYGKIDQEYLKQQIKKYGIKDNINKLLFIQGNGKNKQFVRVIIPKQAQVINKNVTIIDYHDRGQSVNFYLNTPVGKSSSFKLEYYLTNKDCKTYNYKFYKQAGIQNYDLEINKFGEKFQFINNKKDVFIN